MKESESRPRDTDHTERNRGYICMYVCVSSPALSSHSLILMGRGGTRACAATAWTKHLRPRTLPVGRMKLLVTNGQQGSRAKRNWRPRHYVTELQEETRSYMIRACTPHDTERPPAPGDNSKSQSILNQILSGVRFTHFQWLWPYHPMTKDVPTKQTRKPTAGGLT